MIDQLRHLHPIFKLCDLLDVARSGYQAWCTGKIVPARKLEDLRLTVAIKAAHARGRGIYGPLKIQTELAAQGVMQVLIALNVYVHYTASVVLIRRSFGSPPILSILCQWLETYWIVNSLVLHPTKSGWLTLPTFPQAKAGFI